MATVLELEQAGLIVRVDPQLESNEREHRFIFVTPYCQDRISNELPLFVSEWNVEEDPTQQFDALLETFCSGETLSYLATIKPLNHLGNGIWELKTADLRIFGWFCDVNVFIATNVCSANKVKQHNLYAGLAGEAVYARKLLNLDDPKYLSGEHPSDVVTGYAFS